MTDNNYINLSLTDHFLLDMDGTLLDLKFDNDFWQVEVPRQYALLHGYELAVAQDKLFTRMRQVRGSLQWYSVDFWSDETGLDIVAMKLAARGKIKIRDGVIQFLQCIRDYGCRVSLLTNAHAATIDIKFNETDLGHYFDDVICSHDFDAPKEAQDFWLKMQEKLNLIKAKSVFIDDSVAVLQAAKTFGIPRILHIVKPDSSQAAVFHEEFESLVDFKHIKYVNNDVSRC